MLSELKNQVIKAIQSAGYPIEPEQVRLEATKTLEHGHFALNAAMVLAKKAGENPREVAQKIAENLKGSPFQKVEIAGPGFINLFIEQNFYSKIVGDIVKSMDTFLESEIGLSGKTMLIDYSSPNIAKPLGVHHLLSTIIGDSIKKCYRRAGWNVIGDNYLGDLGTQFGKLIYAIKTWGNIADIEKNPIEELLALYVKFHNEAESNPELDDFARAESKKFEEGDQENRALWKRIVEWSMIEINQIYQRLGIEFDEMNGESFYEDKMPTILKEGREKGIFVDGKEGAWIVPMENPEEPPAIVRRSDGATLYLTRDLAQTAYWEKTWQPDLMVWVVDVAQSLHFRQRFYVTQKLGLTDAQMVHVDFGRMQFKDGSMSTRKGNIIKLEALLDEAEERSLKLIQEKAAEMSESEQNELARQMGIGSIRYNILQQNRISNITFDWDKMLNFEGNSAPYLMYTIARAKSVLRKAEVNVEQAADFKLELTDDHETNVILQALQYSDALKRAQGEFKPNHIANFLYDLAQKYNAFYNALPILKADENSKNSRLIITALVIRLMEDGFNLLGLEVPEKM